MEKITKFIKQHLLSKPKNIFYGAMVIGVLVFFISGLVTRGYSYYNLFQSNRSDYFMDFFNPLSELLNGPYAHGSIYPPLPALFYKLMLRMVPFDIASHSAFAIRSSQAGEMVFLFYTLLTLLAFFILLTHIKKGSSLEKYLFSFIILFSGPVLFTLERANIIFIALLFLMVFVFFKDSKRPIVREVALISLAISAAIKLYPALFLLLLIKEKRFIETIRVIAYGIVLFFLPFFGLGGLKELPVLYKNILTTSNGQLAWGVGYAVNIQSIARIIGALIGNFGGAPVLIGKIVSYVFLLVGIITAFFVKPQWKTVSLLSLLIITVPPISFEYSLIFMIIPLMMFLKTEDKIEQKNYFYLICYVLLFIPYIFGPVDMINKGFGIHARPLTYGVLIQNVVLAIMGIVLIIDEFRRNMLKSVKKNPHKPL